MQTAANRDLGRLLYALMRERMVEAGYDMPIVIIGKLGDMLEFVTREVHELVHSLDPDHDTHSHGSQVGLASFALESHPHTKILVQTFETMCWFGSLGPDDARLALQALRSVVRLLNRYGCRALDDDELADVQERIFALLAQQQEPGSLGVIGHAVYDMVTQPLVALPVRKNTPAARRRRAYLQKAMALCLELEGAPVAADQKAVGARLGEALQAELRASNASRTEHVMDLFWKKIVLLYGRKG